MRIGVPREVYPGEQRVAATPATVARLRELGFEVDVESRAGKRATFRDEDYVKAGARIVDGPEAVYRDAQIVLKVCEPTMHPAIGRHEVELLREGTFLASFIWPIQKNELLHQLAERKVTVYAMDQVPRVTRAQKMDALSSMSNIVGYRAVVEAANHFGSFFAGQITAAGRTPPAKVLVIGAGVAGLAAIAAARGLGAIVRAFDTRSAVREQIESLGAEFLELDFEESGEGKGGYAKEMSKEFLEAEHELFLKQALEVDIVITTALVPGKKAPILWTADMVRAMRPGSVVVDLASVQGGNCELTEPGEVVTVHGVTIIGSSNLTSRLATTASQLYATNLVHLLEDMGGGNEFRIDMEDEVIRPGIVVHEGDITYPPPARVEPAPAAAPTRAEPEAEPTVARAPVEPIEVGRETAAGASSAQRWVGAAVVLGLFGLWAYLRSQATGQVASTHVQDFVQHLTVFVLACFVGWQVIWNVTPALHTPLMSVTNAISGIILIGGLLAGSRVPTDAAVVLGALATLLATINVAGGFLVTQRMLRMFKKDAPGGEA